MLRNLLLSILLIIIPASLVTPAFAQQGSSNCIVTAIGTIAPGLSPTFPANCNQTGDPTGILSWAQKINDALQPGFDYGTGQTWWNKMTTDISNGTYHATNSISTGTDNLYWCTFTVIDAFRLSGREGLTIDPDLAVVEMMKTWQKTPGYIFLPYDPGNTSNPANKDTLSKVKPGFPFFLANDPTQTINEEHTGIVKTITIDQNGNGSLTTLESNSVDKSHIMTITNWVVINTVANFALRGFGGV